MTEGTPTAVAEKPKLSPEQISVLLSEYIQKQIELSGPDCAEAILAEHRGRVENLTRARDNAKMLATFNEFLARHAEELAAIIPPKRSISIFHRPGEGDKPGELSGAMEEPTSISRAQMTSTTVPSGARVAGQQCKVTWADGRVAMYPSAAEALRVLNVGPKAIGLPPAGRYSAWVYLPKVGVSAGFTCQKVLVGGNGN